MVVSTLPSNGVRRQNSGPSEILFPLGDTDSANFPARAFYVDIHAAARIVPLGRLWHAGCCPRLRRTKTVAEGVMRIMHSVSTVLAVSSLAAVASMHAVGQQRPEVQIPQPGVPQIMTIEGNFVRVAYNNEGYVILGYQI